MKIKNTLLAAISLFITTNILAQDTALINKYDTQTIHFYKSTYQKNGIQYRLKDLKNEFPANMPSYNNFSLYRQYTTKSYVYYGLSLAGLIGSTVFLKDTNNDGVKEFSTASGICLGVSLISMGFTIHFGSQARISLQQTFKERNREILFGK